VTLKVSDSFREIQLKEIVKFRAKLQEKTKRETTLSEALMSWIALGYADDHRNNFFIQEI